MPSTRVRSRVDGASLIGILFAVGAIVGGLLLEKGSIKDIAQITAAIIVLGGTTGAVLISTPTPTLRLAFSQLRAVFWERQLEFSKLIDEIIVYATTARKHGITSLESDAIAIHDPFLRKAINLAVDGVDTDELKMMMELDIDLASAQADEAASVFESGGGYAPTIGIIGAVLGLIQVMKNLANIGEVGHGIAVAFVATVYGVALANIFLLPAAGKIRARAAKERLSRELILDGVLSIVEGANPKMIRTKLSAYLQNGAAPEGRRMSGSGIRAA